MRKQLVSSLKYGKILVNFNCCNTLNLLYAFTNNHMIFI